MASGSPTRPSTTRCRRSTSRPAWPRSSTASAGPAGSPCPASRWSPVRAIAGPSTFTLYEVGTVKVVDLDGGAARAYLSVDGGMSDNIRTALYEANFSCTLAGRTAPAPPRLSRVVGKHCESGDIVVMDEFLPADVAPGDLLAVPGTGRLLPGPCPASTTTPHGLRWSPCGTVAHGSWSAARRSTTCWPWTSGDRLRDQISNVRPDGWTNQQIDAVSEPRPDKPLRVALLGCGVVGSAVARAHPAPRRPRGPGRPPDGHRRHRQYAAPVATAATFGLDPRCSRPTPRTSSPAPTWSSRSSGA